MIHQQKLTTHMMVIIAVLGISAAYYLLQGNSSRDKPPLDLGRPPSEVGKPATRKAPAGVGGMASKQEGWDNADPGNSVNGEDETEIAKLKGTVSTKRPQE